MSPLEWAFWVAATLIGYGTVGYPALIWLLARLAPRPVRKEDITPTVTCVIAARNESSTIGAKLENLLSLDYPPDRFDVVVVSDGSTDETCAIVEERAHRAPNRVTLLRVPTPRGKAFALNVGVAVARGEIILFADARQLFDCGAIRALARNFADLKVGAVSGTLLLNEAGREDLGKGLALYWPFEKFLRKVESRSGSTIGCTGAIYAVRRALFSPLPEGTLLDDVLVPMRILLCGYRVVFEDQARAFDRLSASLSQEFDRKVRTLAGNVQLLYLEPALLNPLRGAATWRFISHKFLPRVLMPYCLATLFLVSIPLDGLLYRGALTFQVMVYVAGLFGLFLGPHVGRLLGLPSAFLLLNAACVVGAVRYTFGLGRELWRGQHA